MDNLSEPTVNESAEFSQAWLDATLDAEHWFALRAVSPLAAAMLLCGFNPNDDAYEVAERCTNAETGPKELTQEPLAEFQQRVELFQPNGEKGVAGTPKGQEDLGIESRA